MAAEPLRYLPEEPERANGLSEPVLHLAEALYQRYTRRSPENATGAAAHDGQTLVFVLGAAASYLSGMPSWESLRRELTDAAADSFSSRDRFVEELWDRLSPYIGPPPTGRQVTLEAELNRRTRVEQILSVACEIEMARKEILTVLTNRYGSTREPDGAGAPPQLGYELIAHFLRHEYIDHVINFNFDEILDAALINELGPEGFVRIISDHDPRPDRNRRAPRYIKLHGTISAPQSLRFTKEQTQTISPEMLRIIDDAVFSGGEVHLVTLGYSWSDHDFVYWVLARLDRIRRVTIVRLGRDIPPLLRDLYARARADGRGDIEQLVEVISMGDLAAVLRPQGPALYLDDLLWTIANGVERRLFQNEVPFVPAARHILLGHVFRPGLSSRTDRPWEVGHPNNKHAPRRRLRLEIWLQTFKCQGMVNLSVLSQNPRVHTYWRMCQETAGGAGAAIEASLPDTLKPNTWGQVKETFFSDARDCKALQKEFLADGNLNIGAGRIGVPMVDLASGKVESYKVGEKTFLRGELERIWEDVETEVVTTIDERSEWLFRKPRHIRSYHDLCNTTEGLVEQNWSHLLVIAESASWLFSGDLLQKAQGRERGPEPRVLLITAGDDGLSDWAAWSGIRSGIDAARARLSGVEVLELSIPWWRHNRHLTLGVRIGGRRTRSPLLEGSLYFRRRLKDSRISPVSVDDSSDLCELLLIFLSYTLRAIRQRTQCDRELDSQGQRFLSALREITAAVETGVGDGLLSEEQETRWRLVLEQLNDPGTRADKKQ